MALETMSANVWVYGVEDSVKWDQQLYSKLNLAYIMTVITECAPSPGENQNISANAYQDIQVCQM